MEVLYHIVLPFIISLLIQSLFIRLSGKKAFCTDPIDTDKPHRFHNKLTPRAGGVGIFFAFSIGVLISDSIPMPWDIPLSADLYKLSLITISLPAFMVGFYEDIKLNINPRKRLLIISFGVLLGIVLINGIIPDIGFGRLPLWFAVPFTLFAVTGVSNAINIIDGFNGLAGGVSIIALIFFGLVAYIHHDLLILTISIILIGAIAGFFVLNFPRGKIFLGDGGAYLIGFLLAEISVLLVKRNPNISPWFPVVILGYPIFEVIFSIYRRRFKQGKPAFKPDRLHFHSLIYKRVVKNNPRTSVYVWGIVSVLNMMALLFRSNTIILILISFIFSLIYIYLYRRVVRFRLKELRIELFSKPVRFKPKF